MTDRLSLTNALAEAKIDRPAAERIATEIFDAIQNNVATKADIQLLKADLQLLKTDIELVEHRLMTRLGSLVVVVAGLLFVALRYLPPVH
jgi:hypothetical protein